MLKKALEIAKRAHAGQKDKGGHPYIEHPVTVARMVRGRQAKIVALLHDVCEDSEITLEDLKKAGFSRRIVAAVDAVTKRQGERYRHYLMRVKNNRLATRVKIADATHNSDFSRISGYSPADIARSERYRNTIVFLKMNKRKMKHYQFDEAPMK